MRPEILNWAAWAALALGLACVLLVLAGAIGHRLGLLHFSPALKLLGGSAMLAVPAFALALLVLLSGLGRHASAGSAGLALAGLACALAVLVPAYLFKQKAQSVPAIHDISTDTENPPAWVALRPAREAAPNGAADPDAKVVRQQRQAYPDLAPITLVLPPAAAFDKALAAAEAMGWEIAAAAPADGRIEAVATTPFWGFKDDVVIRVSGAGEERSRIDIRSASRVGRSDVGANAERIRAFRERLGG